MTYFEKDVDKCTCVIMFMYMIVSQTIQLLVGVIMKRVGVEWGYRLVVLLMVIVLVDVLVIHNRLKKKQESLLSTQQPLVLPVSYIMRCFGFLTARCPCDKYTPFHSFICMPLAHPKELHHVNTKYSHSRKSAISIKAL